MASANWKNKLEAAATVKWEDVAELAEAKREVAIRTSVDADPEDAEMNLQDMVVRRTALDTIKKWAEEELKTMNEELLLLMNEADQDKVRLWDGMRLERRASTTASKIEPTKLLEVGVTLDQIQSATVQGRPYQYVMITKEKN
jgi:hypothetical protein